MRRSIQLAGVEHGEQPFPVASMAGPFLATSGIHGIDAATGALVEGAEAQIAQAFANLRDILEVAGAGPADVVQVLVTLTDRANRPLVNAIWREIFPDPASRPARNTSERDLPGGSLCQLIAYAYVQARRM